MRRTLVLVVLLALPLAAAAEGEGGFFTREELSALDEALTLLNMTRADLAFDKLVIDDDWRLEVVDRTLTHPLTAADCAWAWSSRAAVGPEAVLVHAARELGLAPADARTRAPTAIDWARARVAGATAGLDAAERERLRRWAYAAMVEGDAHDGLVPKPAAEEDPEEMLALAARVDRGRYVQAAAEIVRSILPWLEGRAPGTFASSRDIVYAGKGDDVHDLRESPPAVLVDLGGNDRYLAPARATPDHPVTVVIDLGGDDVYGDGESLSAGAGFFGVGVLWDRGDGDDVYEGGHLSQGNGLFGAGVLIDEGGDDVYRCRDTGQGAGSFGVGLLFDLGEGNDSFHADLFGQGFAYVGGFGLLRNESGNDLYDAGGVHLHYPLFNDRFQSLSQGFSIGMRPYASGGIGLLLDDRGNDRYLADIFGQGASYWFSYGALVDRDGNDTYNLGQYGQGGGIHLSTGCLLDLAGQDLYYDMHGVGTGGAHDFSVGILVDRAGDDYYAGSGGTMGGALTNSFALLLDGGGNDGYSAVKVHHTEGGGRAARGMGSIGVFLDLGGKDLHGRADLEGTSWTKETYGAGIDRPDPPPSPTAPPARPHLTPEEAEARVRKRAWDTEKGAFDLARLWDVAREWAVGEMADVVPRALDHLHAMGEPALEHALSRVGSKVNLEFEACRKLLRLFGDEAVPGLVAMLDEEEPRRRVYACYLLADLRAVSAAPRIVALLGDDETRRVALDAIASLGLADRWEEVAACLDDGEERTRVTAVRALQRLRATGAVPALVRKLSGDVFTVRFAAEDVLVSFGDAAVPALLEVAEGDGGADTTARRHAIRALGRIGDLAALRPLVARLSDPDWGVRYDAAGAVGAFLGRPGRPGYIAGAALRLRTGTEKNRHVLGRIRELLK